MPKKPAESESGGIKAPVAAEKGPWGKDLPNLAEWLCAASWDDGSPLGKTRLSLWRSGNDVIVALQLQDLGGVRVEARADHPARALKLLDTLLGADQVPWQQDPYPIGGGGRKKK